MTNKPESKPENEHLVLAGIFSRKAHNHWLTAMRDGTDDAVRMLAMRAGDAAIADADRHLRLHGVGEQNITDAEREMLLTDECFNPSNTETTAETSIDFRPLRHAVIAEKAVVVFNRIAAAAVLVALGYFAGVANAPQLPVDWSAVERQLQQLDTIKQQEEQKP